MEPNIVVRDVHKGFGAGRHHVPILQGISLEVIAGETLYLVGPSGSGKTTLLSLMGCILSPDRGSIRVLGYETSSMSSQQLTAFRRKYLSFVFQSFNLFPNLSALDNIRLMLCMRGVDRRSATRRASELLEQVGVWHRARLRPPKLSTGECQRVAIARALANEPTILLADEPTASLDAENGQAVMRLIKRLAHERGVTLVIVTHDDRILPFADRILRLEDGRLTGEETVRRPPYPLVLELLPAWIPRQEGGLGLPEGPPGRAPQRPVESSPVELAQTACSTNQLIVPDHAAGLTRQVIISTNFFDSLITREIIVSCSGASDFLSDPASFDTVSRAALSSGTTALRM